MEEEEEEEGGPNEEVNDEDDAGLKKVSDEIGEFCGRITVLEGGGGRTTLVTEGGVKNVKPSPEFCSAVDRVMIWFGLVVARLLCCCCCCCCC